MVTSNNINIICKISREKDNETIVCIYMFCIYIDNTFIF